MLTLWQAEWCPHSHRVRQRLTELGVPVELRQVPPEPEERGAMEAETGVRSIPTLTIGQRVVSGADEIIGWLDAEFPEPPGAARHREKMRLEWTEWVELETSRGG